MASRSALLLLADARLPAGGHAHSGGLEAAVAARRVLDPATLAGFLRGRLATAGLVAATFAAAGTAAGTAAAGTAAAGTAAAGTAADAAGSGRRLTDLDLELDARTPSPALRRASRAQGRALLRAGRAMWPLPATDGWPATDGPHHPVALGVVAVAAGLSPGDAALAAAYGAVTGPASAAVRLLGLDPYHVQAVLAGLADECDAVAERADGLATAGRLPAATAPLLDIGAENHATWEVRLFAS
jgi:urease accessory protein